MYSKNVNKTLSDLPVLGLRGTDCEQYPTPYANGAWSHWIVGSHPTLTPKDLELAKRHEGTSQKHHQERIDSFDRCDTDGFLSQWASGLNAQEESQKAEIAKQGGYDLFPGLYNRQTGDRVSAVLIDGKWGPCWAFCGEDGKFTGKFLGDARTKRAKLYRSGYVVLGEWAPAHVRLRSNGTGLSGNVWLSVSRTDGGYPGRPSHD